MNDIEAKEKLKKEKNAIFVCEIDYLGKKYIKAIKLLKSGIEYVFYEMENDNIKEIEDKEVLQYLEENYKVKDTNIIY